MKIGNLVNTMALVAVRGKTIAGPAMQNAQAASWQMEKKPPSSPIHLPHSSENRMSSFLRRKFSTKSDKEGSSSGLNTEVKDLALCKKVNLDALTPLDNVYGGGPDRPVSLIPDSEILKLDGMFKYCVTKHKETGELDLLLTHDVSAAHVGMKEIAEKRNCDVVMAGHVKLHAEDDEHMELYSFTNTSGHLQPEGNNDQKRAAVIAFDKKGLNARGRYVPKIWDENLQRYRGAQIDSTKIDSTNEGD